MTPAPTLSATRNEPEDGSVIHLHTLGEAVITVGDRQVRPTSPTVFAALLYLGVERGQRVPRTALQGLLFPDADERSGSHSLRQLLYKLRQLGAPIQSEGDVVWLNPGDVHDDASNGAAPAAPAVPASNGNGRKSSHFLAGYAPRISAPFDEWLEQQRASVGSSLRRGLLARMAARRSAADWPAVEEIAQEILRVDAFNEEATLALAEATALSGSKAEALRILERYESEVGRNDLKLPASVLRKRISERLPERRPQKLDTPFVGREPETEAMRQAIGQLRQGVAGTVVIVGEPGIGKTRLLEEMSALATLEGVNVQTVRCQPHYASRPMGVFIELVPALLQCRGALGVAPEMLEQLTLLTNHRDDRTNRPVDARDDSTRSGILMAAVRDLVDAVSAETPLLVAVEDAHWADPTSLTELASLVQGAKGRRLLLVYTTRVLERVRKAGAISDAAALLRLKPLVEESMATLAAHLIPGPKASNSSMDVRTWCVSTAAGNPLYIQVLCAHYEETGQPFKVPPSMRAGIIRRIEQLPSDCRRLLEFSALLGRHSSLDALRSLLAVSPLLFLKTIQTLESEGFVRTRDGAARLSHDLLCECTLELVPPLSKQALHSCVAANLESRYEATHDASLLWDCADHWAASGESGKAMHFVVRCARHAADIGRAATAVALLRTAMRLASGPAERASILSELLMAAKAADDYSAMGEAARQLGPLQVGQTKNVHSETELRLIEAAWGLSLNSGNAIPQLLECARTANAVSAHRTDAALLLLRIAHERGDVGLAGSAFHSVEAVLDPTSRIYSNRLLPLVYNTSFGSRAKALELAGALRRDLDLFPIADELRAARNLGVAMSILGQPDAQVELSKRYYEKAGKLDLVGWQFNFAASTCYGLEAAEELDLAEVWFSRAEELRGASGASSSETIHLLTGVELALARRDRELALGRLSVIKGLNPGESIRVNGAIRSFDVRIEQLDATFRCAPDTIRELLAAFDAAKGLSGADSLAVALFEALARDARWAERDQLLEEYVTTSRRERTPLHRELKPEGNRKNPLRD